MALLQSAMLLVATSLLSTVSTVNARDLHEARVFVREMASPVTLNSRSLADDDGHPDVMALTIHMDDEQVTNFLLARNRQAENSFPIVAANNEFPTIQPGELKGPALYVDSRIGGVFAATTDADGQREFEGSFSHEGERYRMSRETTEGASKRGSSSDEGRAYVLRKVSETKLDRSYDEPELDELDEHLERLQEQTEAQTVSGDYDVKIGIYLDNSVYDYWLREKGNHNAAISAINYKFSYSLAAFQVTYSSIVRSRDGFSITPWFAKLVVNTDYYESPLRDIDRRLTQNDPKTQKTSAENLLNSLVGKVSWMKSLRMQPGYAAGDNIDVFLFWTGYDIVRNNDVLGLAKTGSICQGHSMAVVEDVGFETWMSAAHEIGHVLGAKHDGDKTYAPTCYGDDGYLMRPSTSVILDYQTTNHMTFSTCSIQRIRQFLSSLVYNNCLTAAGSNGFPVGYVNPEPGAVYSLDDQCRMMFGSTSSQTGCGGYNKGAQACNTRLRCLYKNLCSPGYRPADGTPCGGSKSCYQGYCQY